MPPWRPLLTMAGPSILPRGGCAHFPQGLAVLGSMHWARGCHRQTAPLSRAWAAHGSVAEGGTRAETGAQWPEPVLSPALCTQLEATLDLAERRRIRSAIRELQRQELEREEETLASKRFRPERSSQRQDDKENWPQ